VTNRKVLNQGQICHPDRSGGICSFFSPPYVDPDAGPHPS
jgi:hypothetical protein